MNNCVEGFFFNQHFLKYISTLDNFKYFTLE